MTGLQKIGHDHVKRTDKRYPDCTGLYRALNATQNDSKQTRDDCKRPVDGDGMSSHPPRSDNLAGKSQGVTSG
ncbi:hypothetical protein [Paenibacillus sp. CGMCC 1.18879]|uniref:hypothetical protein n=1 Tax=Paenibacillus sp. CGMCC 1.18879 TaxID=2834466 RepID=UPI001CA84BB2|nr:hypothetical protein [Paenibacillus sp. CGMCC 1.18879]MBY9082603.1 hypothetical protein [Paenibacillus sp. CGMCC 1.18879]